MDPDDEALREPPMQEVPPRSAPVMDVVPPPPASAPSDGEADTAATSAKAETAGPKPTQSGLPAAPSKAGNGVTAAIIATVIIVLGLAALAVFAYLQSPK